MPWYKDCRDFSKLDVNRFVRLQTLPFWEWKRLRDCRFHAQTLPLDKCSKVPFLAVSLNYTLPAIEFALFYQGSVSVVELSADSCHAEI